MILAAHCATRLRLVIGDNEKCDSKAVENIDGVKGVFFRLRTAADYSWDRNSEQGVC